MSEKGQRYTIPKWVRILILVAAFFSIGLGIVWIMNILGIIPKPWFDNVSKIFPPILSLLSIVFDKDTRQVLLQKLLKISSETKALNEEKSSPDTSPPAQPPMSINVSPSMIFSPNITVSPNQTTTLPSSPPDAVSYTGTMVTPQTTDISATSSSTHTIPTVNHETNLGTPQTPKATAMQISSRLVFHFNTPLNDPSDFYGRARERATLLGRIHNRASVAIVGPRRIGKTWLMQYVKLVTDSSERHGFGFAIGYLNATNPQCRTIAGFTTKAAEALNIPIQKIEHAYGGLDILARAAEDLYVHHIIPVLCIDEFEGLDNPREFDLNFLQGLRAMTQETLVLVTASKKPLPDVVVNILGEHARTSPFFNVFEHIMLKPFNRKEAEIFVHDKNIKAGFTEQECSYLLEHATVYGSDGEKYWPPIRLQLLGQMLLNDKNAAREEPEYYRPHDPKYWIDFERRLNEQYKTTVER